MLYDDLNIQTVVCLTCGAKVSVDKLAVVDVGDTVAPDDIKAKGGFFQTIACPKCRKGLYFGFLADLDMYDDDDVDEDIEEEPASKPKRRKTAQTQKAARNANPGDSKKIQRTEDGTIIIDDDEMPEEVIEMERRAEIARKAAGVKTPKVKKKKKSKVGKPVVVHQPNRASQQKAQCTTCGEVFETGDIAMGAFGSRCRKCMRLLKSKCG